MKTFLQFTWELPQTLIGLLICIFSGSKYDTKEKVFRWRSGYGLSLGYFIFVSSTASYNTLQHERGHQIQSAILGPLYLLIIAIPSAIWCHCFENYRRNNDISYYSLYCERWADKLGGVIR